MKLLILSTRIIATVVFLLLTLHAVGQETQEKEKKNQFSIDLNLLGRGEMRYGGFTEGDADNSAQFLMERTRLILNYKRPHLEMKVSAQHSGIWGQKGKGSFNLYEAWAKLSTNNGFFAQVGRQALSYDDERIIGPNDWAMAASSHDVIKLGYEGAGHKVHAIIGFNQNAENITGGTYYKDGAQPYKSMQTLWYHYDIPNTPLSASLLFMNIGMQAGDTARVKAINNPDKTEYQQLIGVYVSYRTKRWLIEGSYYHQLGRTVVTINPKNDRELRGMKLNAWMANISAQYKITSQVGVMAGFDYLSGDDYFVLRKAPIGLVEHKEIKYFNPVYGSNHKFYGMMDFFYVQAFTDSFSPGLQNLYAGVTYNPIQKLKLKAVYHYLAMATTLEDINKTLGHDIDIEASYQILKDARVSIGFSYMTSSKTMELLGRAEKDKNLKWAWLSLSVTPRIFSTKW